MKAVLVFVATIAFAIAPFFTDPFSGFEPADLPVPVENPILQPAGWAFSIWGLIYLWLLAHGAFGLFVQSDDPAWDATRWPLFISVGLGASWLAVAGQSPVLATAQLVVMAAAAIVALFRAVEAMRPLFGSARWADRWLLVAPIAVYAGWVTAASGVAAGTLAVGYGLLGERPAAYVMLAVIAAAAFAVQATLRRAPEYGLAVIWALAAIIARNIDGGSTAVAVAAGAGIAVMLLSIRRAIA